MECFAIIFFKVLAQRSMRKNKRSVVNESKSFPRCVPISSTKPSADNANAVRKLLTCFYCFFLYHYASLVFLVIKKNNFRLS